MGVEGHPGTSSPVSIAVPLSSSLSSRCATQVPLCPFDGADDLVMAWSHHLTVATAL